MASGNKRRGVGERVLESKHVIGLFMLMLLFSGLFFTLGYVMGRNQLEGQVRAANGPRGMGDALVSRKKETPRKPGAEAPAADSAAIEPATQSGQGGWEFYDSKNAKPEEERLKPAPAPAKALPVHSTPVASKTNSQGAKSLNAPLIPHGSYMLQVAALTKQSDALDVATRLQKKKFPAFVISAQADKYYRVQVGPYSDQQSAEAARKGLESAGFKAIVKH
ncbi:MAG TPA: SPOR domain-containing protein [Candidatus Saccharimonadales bacterium]|nr:SPOR domain-containing protein [Candidatus Saccharimonadales bacterium]